MAKSKERGSEDIVNIIIVYADGREEKIDRGIVTIFPKDTDSEYSMSNLFCNMRGSDLAHFVWGVMQLGHKLGIFDNKED